MDFFCWIYLARAILTCDNAPKETGKVSTMANFNDNTAPRKIWTSNEFDQHKFLVFKHTRTWERAHYQIICNCIGSSSAN